MMLKGKFLTPTKYLVQKIYCRRSTCHAFAIQYKGVGSSLYHQHRLSQNKFHLNTMKRHRSCLSLYDSLSETYKPIPLSIPNESEENETQDFGIAWYTCGPTVYDSAHLGHARTYVSLDIIHRALLYNHRIQSSLRNSESHRNAGKELKPIPPPIFIMNVTDVDDKILTRAKEQNIHPLELARKFEQEFWEDMDTLNVMRPTVVTRVTDHVESSIIPYIEKIMSNGMAYVIDDDGVYFDVNAFEASKCSLNRYGKLASLKRDSDGVDGDGDTFFAWEDTNNLAESDSTGKQSNRKKDSRDFVLWKRRDGDDSENQANGMDVKVEEMCWDSPWGKGRPGWHIECSAMIESTMKIFDQHKICVHAGGIDLKFPHHTNEIAQAEAFMHPNTSAEWIPHWVHTGHLHIDGLKMSKSLKNFITIRDILKVDAEEGDAENDKRTNFFHSPADDFRLWCLGLSGSYRGPATYSKSRLIEAKVTREKLLRFLVDGERWVRNSRNSVDCYAAKWSNEDHDLVRQVSTYQALCEKSLLGMSLNDYETSEVSRSKAFDFDGATFLTESINLAEEGSKYVSKVAVGEHPIYPVEHALEVLRNFLSIVGFSDDTVKAGISHKQRNHILGDSEALVNELVDFRRSIREASLNYLKSSKTTSGKDQGSELSKTNLKICDDLRDDKLPAIGLEVFDGDAAPTWRFVTPTTQSKLPPRTKKNGDKKTTLPHDSLLDLNEANFFQIGRYEGLFTAFDSDGIPTKNMDGSDLSKRAIKKLIKKREAYFRKMEK
jgi:cysteinyl-tRNA synthetase